MNSGRLVLVILGVVLIVAVVEGSAFLQNSLRYPRGLKECFTCRAEDQPPWYPVVKYFNKMKDSVVRGVNALMDNVKEKLA